MCKHKFIKTHSKSEVNARVIEYLMRFTGSYYLRKVQAVWNRSKYLMKDYILNQVSKEVSSERKLNSAFLTWKDLLCPKSWAWQCQNWTLFTIHSHCYLFNLVFPSDYHPMTNTNEALIAPISIYNSLLLIWHTSTFNYKTLKFYSFHSAQQQNLLKTMLTMNHGQYSVISDIKILFTQDKVEHFRLVATFL